MSSSWLDVVDIDLFNSFFRGSPKWPTPGDLAKLWGARQSPALELIDEHLVWAYSTPGARLIINMAPQEGKSERVSIAYPIWCLSRRPDMRIVLTSYSQMLANRNGRRIRNLIRSHPEIGLSIDPAYRAVGEWGLVDSQGSSLGSVYSVGRGGGVTGRAVDLLIIDDPVKGYQDASSRLVRDQTEEWFKSDLRTRLGPGAPIVIIQTRWHYDDLSGRLISSDKSPWRVVNIPAQAEDSNDPLGRKPGEFLTSVRGRSVEEWESIKTEVGSYTWSALYQGRPSPKKAGLINTSALSVVSPDSIIRRSGSANFTLLPMDVIHSWDLSFSGRESSDYVAGQVWGRYGQNYYLLDWIHQKLDFSQTVEQLVQLYHRWPQTSKILVEQAANGEALISHLSNRGLPLYPVKPKSSKEVRAIACQPLIEAGSIHLVDNPGVEVLLGEFRDFPNGKNDDQVDAMTQALGNFTRSDHFSFGG